jgi:hypothetical protein
VIQYVSVMVGVILPIGICIQHDPDRNDLLDHPSNPMIPDGDEVRGLVVNEKVELERRVGNEGRFLKGTLV